MHRQCRLPSLNRSHRLSRTHRLSRSHQLLRQHRSHRLSLSHRLNRSHRLLNYPNKPLLVRFTATTVLPIRLPQRRRASAPSLPIRHRPAARSAAVQHVRQCSRMIIRVLSRVLPAIRRASDHRPNRIPSALTIPTMHPPRRTTAAPRAHGMTAVRHTPRRRAIAVLPPITTAVHSVAMTLPLPTVHRKCVSRHTVRSAT